MTDDEDLWSDEICALVDAAFETVSRNPSDHEEAFAYRRAIAAALRQPTQSDGLVKAATALYMAGRWSCDQEVDEASLWAALRDALGLPVGTETNRAALQEQSK